MNKIPLLVCKNFFDAEELDLIWDELNFLSNPVLMQPPGSTGTSSDTEGRPLKSNKGVFLEQIYKEPVVSSIWRCTKKIFSGFTSEFGNMHMANRLVLATTRSKTLVSYYENGDYYLPHLDSAVTSVLFWFYREPKEFIGGDLVFPDTGEVVKISNNTMVMFPSWAFHEVTPIQMSSESEQRRMGRYCVTLFLYFDP